MPGPATIATRLPPPQPPPPLRPARRVRGAWLAVSLLFLAGCPADRSPAPVSQANNLSRLKRLEAAFREDPCSIRGAVELAEAFRQERKPERAAAIYAELLKCGNEVSQGLAMNALAQLDEEEGDVAEAVDWLWKSTTAGTPETQSQAWFLLAALLREHQLVPPILTLPRDNAPPFASADSTWREVAEDAYAMAVNTGSPAPEAFKALAELALESGMPARALEQYQIYLAANPGDHPVWIIAAELAIAQSDFATARFYLETVASRGSQEQRQRAHQMLDELAAALAETPPEE